MPFSNGYNGDVRQLPVIIKTLEAKLYTQPGVTCNPDVSVTAAGEALYYYTHSDESAATGHKLGAKIDYTSTGVERKTIAIEEGISISDVIPAVNYQTVSADVVGDKVVQETLKAANKINEDYIEKLEAAGEDATTTYDAADPYGSLLKLRAEFVKDNKEEAMKPTAAFVDSEVYSALLAKNVIIFKDGRQWGDLMGFSVIECPDLTSKVVMLNANAMASAQNINNLVVVDATPAGYPGGTLIGGEIGFANAKAELVDSKSKKVLKPILKMGAGA